MFDVGRVYGVGSEFSPSFGYCAAILVGLDMGDYLLLSHWGVGLEVFGNGLIFARVDCSLEIFPCLAFDELA